MMMMMMMMMIIKKNIAKYVVCSQTKASCTASSKKLNTSKTI